MMETRNMNRILLGGVFAAASLFGNAQTLQDAVQLTDREQFERATTTFKRLLSASPNDGATWYYFGQNYFANEQQDSAEYCYRHGAEVNPRYPLNKAGIGKILMVKGQRAEAQAQFDDAIATAEDKVNKYSKDVKAATYREVARGLGTGNKPDMAAAVTMLNKSLELAPADAEAFMVKGDLQLQSGSFDASAAAEAYKKAGNLLPASARPVASVAQLYYRAKSYDAAIAEFDRAISIDPGFAPAYSGRAEAYFMTKSFDKATSDYNKYLELNQGNRSARIRYAKFLFLTGKYTASLEEIAKLQGAGVNDPTLKRIEGYDLVETQDFTNGMARLEEYFAMQPQEKQIPSDIQYYARALSGLGNDSLAAEKMLNAARMPKADPNLYKEAAALYIKIKRPDMAVVAYREKMDKSKPEVNDWYYMGGAAQKAGLYSTADSAWTSYVEKQPNIFQGYLGRARANAAMDSTKTTWQAKPFYEDVIRHMKPEELTTKKVELEEAYFYLGFYSFTKEKDMGAAKCWFAKVKELNAGTSNTKVGSDMLLTKDLKDVAAKDCTLL